MTNDEVIRQVARDPLVRQAHTRFMNGAPVDPSEMELNAIAAAELQNELNSFLNRPTVRRRLLEADYSLTVSSGGTAATGGTYFTLPDYIGSVISVTMGSSLEPLRKWRIREEFDQWYFETIGDSTTASDIVGWLEWGRAGDGRIRILISPSVGTESSAVVHYIRKLMQPVSIGVLPDDVHFVIVTGAKNRASGGKHQFSYDLDVAGILDRLKVMIGGASPLPHGRNTKVENWRESQLIAGESDSSHSPFFVSRS